MHSMQGHVQAHQTPLQSPSNQGKGRMPVPRMARTLLDEQVLLVDYIEHQLAHVVGLTVQLPITVALDC